MSEVQELVERLRDEGTRRPGYSHNAVEKTLLATAAATLEALQAEVERLTDLLSEAEQSEAEALQGYDDATARAERAEGALEPFADICGEGDEDFPDDTKVTITFGRTTHYALTLGDLRRAADVIYQCSAGLNGPSSATGAEAATVDASLPQSVEATNEL